MRLVHCSKRTWRVLPVKASRLGVFTDAGINGLPERNMAITFSSKAAQIRIDTILGALEDGPMTALQIAGAVECSIETVRRYMPHLVRDLKLVRMDDGVATGVGHPELTYALRDDDEPETSICGGRIYTQFARQDVTQPIIRRDPMVAAFFGGV